MTSNKSDSPGWKVFHEAIKLAIAEESPYPEAAAFIDGGTPYTEQQIQEAFQIGYAAVVTFPDGSVQVIHPEAAAS